jgi:hypothetical protein
MAEPGVIGSPDRERALPGRRGDGSILLYEEAGPIQEFRASRITTMDVS